MGKPKNTIDDFWKNVDVRGKNECWPWMKSATRQGYGTFRYDGKVRKAHRIALGTIMDVPDDMCVLHTCDNPPCCNPRHLRLGTNAENTKDRDRKGRQQRGSRHFRAKLTEASVIFIRNSGYSDSALSTIFGVGTRAISKVRLGRTWKHVR